MPEITANVSFDTIAVSLATSELEHYLGQYCTAPVRMCALGQHCTAPARMCALSQTTDHG
jgi:hypothetical protein